MKTECGIVGISTQQKCYQIYQDTIHALSRLQHRGRESCGIAYSQTVKKYLGLVEDNFNKFQPEFRTNYMVGHTRYSTNGSKNDITLAQPIQKDNIILVHNGNLPHIDKLKTKYNIECRNDSEFLLEFIIKNKHLSMIEIIQKILLGIRGCFCIILLTDLGIWAFRDIYGYRPLCIGESDNGLIVTSESVALGRYKLVRDIKPGEVLFIKNGLIKETYILKNKTKPKMCIFEHIYFMNRNTIADEQHVETTRYNLGIQLAKEDKTEFDPENSIVMAIPKTAIPSAKGYAFATKIPYIQILQKERNCGRTFILPDNTQRMEMCNKIFYLQGDVGDKNVIIVDDSIVRGNTIKGIVKLFSKAKSVHIRVSSPPVTGTCNYGIDIPTKEELIKNGNSIENIRKEFNVDSLQYLSLEGLQKSMLAKNQGNFCMGCLDGNYNKELEW